MRPVTSSQSWCSARPKERAVVLTALITALAVRLRPAWVRATWAAIPNFRKAETLLTVSILTALRRYNDASQGRRVNRSAAGGILVARLAITGEAQWIHNSSN